MAYISTDEVKTIRNKIKKTFPDYEFSIYREHSSSLHVCIMKSDLIFKSNYEQINHYYIDKHYEGKNREILKKIYDIIQTSKICYDRNFGDPYADYGDNNYFINMSIGKWNKPHICQEIRS
jgi:hypothetical protein